MRHDILDWSGLLSGMADSISATAAVAEIARATQAKVTALEAAASKQSVIHDLMSAVTHPLKSVENPVNSRDSITWGVGLTGAANDGQGHNGMTNSSWANLFHKRLGESFIDGSLVLHKWRSNLLGAYMDRPVDVDLASGNLGFTMKSTGFAPSTRTTRTHLPIAICGSFSSAAGTAKNKGALQFDLTGDNLTFVCCPTNASDEAWFRRESSLG